MLTMAKAALEGVEELMESSGGIGEVSVTVVVHTEGYGLIGRIVVSWVGNANGAASTASTTTAATSAAAPAANGDVVAARAATGVADAVANITKYVQDFLYRSCHPAEPI